MHRSKMFVNFFFYKFIQEKPYSHITVSQPTDIISSDNMINKVFFLSQYFTKNIYHSSFLNFMHGFYIIIFFLIIKNPLLTEPHEIPILSQYSNLIFFNFFKILVVIFHQFPLAENNGVWTYFLQILAHLHSLKAMK